MPLCQGLAVPFDISLMHGYLDDFVVQVLDGISNFLFTTAKIGTIVTQTSLTAPRMLIKDRRAWMKASDYKDPTSTMWIALQGRQTKMHP